MQLEQQICRLQWKITFKYKATLGGQLIASATHLSFFLWSLFDCAEHGLAEYWDKDQIFASLTGYDTDLTLCKDCMNTWWVKMNTYKPVRL